MALSAENAHRRLRAEVNKLSSEVSLVLRYILIQRRRKARVIPGGGLGVVVHKVNSGSICKTHLPAARQGAKLRNGLLLDLTVGVVLAVHADELLSAGIDPGRGASVVIDKVWSSFRSPALFPARRELTGARASGAGVHHGRVVAVGSSIGSCAADGATRTRALLLKGWRAGASSIFGQSSVLVSLALDLGNSLSFVADFSGGSVGCRPVPAGGSGVVVYIIGAAQVIFSAFPACGQAALGVFERAQLAVGASRAIDTRRGRRSTDAGWMGGEVWLGAERVAVGARHGRTWSFTSRSR